MRLAKVVPISLIAIAFGCAAESAEEYPDAVTADPGHYSVLFENDAARVLRIAYGPNERSVMHRHPANCFIAITDASARMTTADDETTEMPLSKGQVGCIDSAEVHLPENIVGEPMEVILVEIKDGAAAGHMMDHDHPDAITADPAHYSVVAENDVVRLIRIAYGPGEASVLHYHPASCSVPLSGGTWRMTDVDGETTEDTTSVGEVECGDASTHLPENTGEAAELILIEFKGRDAFGGGATAS